MQQFFGLVNSVLVRDAETRRRALGLGTFRVVPFSPAAGVIQWLEDTMPLGEYLLGPDKRSGAHARYKEEGHYTFEQVSTGWGRGAAYQLPSPLPVHTPVVPGPPPMFLQRTDFEGRHPDCDMPGRARDVQRKSLPPDDKHLSPLHLPPALRSALR